MHAHLPPLVLDEAAVLRHLASVDVLAVMRRMFAALANGQACQPPQTLALLPGREGDFITYPGALGSERVFGAKLSPYLVKPGAAPLVTAWTMLMSMDTGAPLLLCDANRLTCERTAATTALAVDLLARKQARQLVIVGSGPLARAHLRYALGLRDWSSIAIHSPRIASMDAQARQALRALDPRVRLCDTLAGACAEADVVMLCTSSAQAVLDPHTLARPALVTSISTNVPQAHEVPPAALAGMDVYCDHGATTPATAGEMVLATTSGAWSAAALKGDLADLVEGRCALPDYSRPVFFRSVGMGLEDIALAAEVFNQIKGEPV